MNSCDGGVVVAGDALVVASDEFVLGVMVWWFLGLSVNL